MKQNRNMTSIDTASRRPRVVIIGAGFGGLSAAKQLARVPFDVTIVDRHNYHLFQPLLYQVATAGLSTGDIASPIRGILRDQKNATVILARVSHIDLKRKTVGAEGLRIGFEYLIVATGAQHAYFGHPQWAAYAPGLKTIEDGTYLRRRILLAFEKAETEPDPVQRRRLLNFVVVGGGATGVEMAGAIAELAKRALAMDFRSIDPRCARIILVEAGPRLLPSFDPSLSQAARHSLEQLGVEVHLGAQADRAGRVKVVADLSLPGHPDVFVIGDTALALDENGKPFPGVAPVAKQQGQYVADLLMARARGNEMPPFRYRDFGAMATIGRKRAVAQIGRLKLSGFLACVLWSVAHIYFLIGFRNRLVVAMNWAWNYVTFQRGTRLITGLS